MTALQFQEVRDLNAARAITAAQGLLHQTPQLYFCKEDHTHTFRPAVATTEEYILTRVNQFHYMLIQYMHRCICF